LDSSTPTPLDTKQWWWWYCCCCWWSFI